MTSKAVEATWDISHYRQLRGELVHSSKLLLMQKTKRKTGTGIVYPYDTEDVKTALL